MASVNIGNPATSPSPFPEQHSFTTYGTVSGATASQNTMSATVQQGGATVATGVWNPNPPPGMNWQFDFAVPQTVTGNATLLVTCTGATPGTRSISIH